LAVEADSLLLESLIELLFKITIARDYMLPSAEGFGLGDRASVDFQKFVHMLAANRSYASACGHYRPLVASVHLVADAHFR
jgi:hypothetical protein